MPPAKRTRFCLTSRLVRARARRRAPGRARAASAGRVTNPGFYPSHLEVLEEMGTSPPASAGVAVPYGAPVEEGEGRGPRPLISALVVSYNVKDLLLETLESLYTHAEVPLEAVVVDNASQDGSADAVSVRFPAAHVVRLPKNLGFGRANNLGLPKCRGRFVLLLNPDVMLTPDSLA